MKKTGRWFLSILSKTFIVILIIMFASLNIGLDLWFILGFHWGVAGAAIATIVSQYLAAILSFLVLLHYIRKECQADPTDEHVVKVFDWKTLAGIARVAVPTMITQTILSVGIVVMQALVNSFFQD